MGIPLADKLQLGGWPAFTHPRTQTEAIQFLSKERINIARRSLPHSPQLIQGDDDDDDDEDIDDVEAELEPALEVDV